MKQTEPKIWGVLMQGDLMMDDTFDNKADALKQAKALRNEYAPVGPKAIARYKRKVLKDGWLTLEEAPPLKPSDIKVVEFRPVHRRKLTGKRHGWVTA